MFSLLKALSDGLPAPVRDFNTEMKESGTCELTSTQVGSTR